MNKYVNVPCAKCGKPFTEDDDVVVCPDCGAPHHRSCYLELGHCARQDQHTDGSTWQDPRQEAAPKENVTCPRCGAVNLPDAQYCATCGIPLDGSYQSGSAARKHSRWASGRQATRTAGSRTEAIRMADSSPAGIRTIPVRQSPSLL